MLECIVCSRFYKNKESLRAHRNRYHPYPRKTSKSNENVSHTPKMTKSKGQIHVQVKNVS